MLTPPAPSFSLSVGFDLDDTPIPILDLTGYRVRSEDLDRLLVPAAAGAGDRKNASVSRKALNRRDSSGLFMAAAGGVGGGSGRSSRSGGSGSGGKLFPLQDPGGKLQQLKESEAGGDGDGRGVRANAADEGAMTAEAFITGVYFPLLSVLMPKWMEQLAGNGDDADSSKTVLLVSGVGQPRNEAHRLEDNSTEARRARGVLREVSSRRSVCVLPAHVGYVEALEGLCTHLRRC